MIIIILVTSYHKNSDFLTGALYGVDSFPVSILNVVKLMRQIVEIKTMI